MRLVFAGTPRFAQTILHALLDASHDVALVMTQPDRPAGRGLRINPSDVKALALERGLPVHQPATLKTPECRSPIVAARAQAMVVAAYGLILPQAVLDLMPYGCINVHASLLPRWRGAAPIQRAIQAGDRETGISIMRMEAGLDTGPVYLRESIPIASDDSAQSLQDKLAKLGGQCILQALNGVQAGTLAPVAQASEGVTYASKISKDEAELDWRQSAAELDRQIRAFNPFPVAQTHLRGESVRIWRGCPLDGPQDRPLGTPGVVASVTDARIVVQCGSGYLGLDELQRSGGKRLAVREFLRGCPVAQGERLGTQTFPA
jgi:methionyl-tRNA formyltransferase